MKRTFKKLAKAEIWYTAFVIALSMLLASAGFAQETNTVPQQVDVNINANTGSGWYAQPWVWVVGVALFIIVIVAITSSSRRTREY